MRITPNAKIHPFVIWRTADSRENLRFPDAPRACPKRLNLTVSSVEKPN